MEILKYTTMPNKPTGPSRVSTIPLNLFQTWHSENLPPKMFECVSALKEANPEFKHMFFNDSNCREFIQHHFSAEVLHAYDKLIPGAYKADLWRYCVLYILGGVYLDIKYRCIPPFKLIELTMQEHYVQDRDFGGDHGVYQAFLVCYPKNPILHRCICTIVEYVRQMEYGPSVLFVGPLLVAKQFSLSEMRSWPMKYTGKQIVRNERPIMELYPEYIDECKMRSIRPYYMDSWCLRQVYNLPSLNVKNSVFLTSAASPNTYLSDIKWIDHEEKRVVYGKYSSYLSYEDGTFTGDSTGYVGKIDTLPFQFRGTETKFPDFMVDQLILYTNPALQCMYVRDKMVYKGPDVPSAVPTHTPLLSIGSPLGVEFIHMWHPMVVLNDQLQCTKINYTTPPFFKDLTSSTPCVLWKDQYWTILTKCIQYEYLNKPCKKYAHLFLVLDKSLNLVKYSEFFILENSNVSIVTDLHVERDALLLGYSISNGICMVSEYTDTPLQWTEYVVV